MLQEEPGMRKRALDLGQRPDLLGWNHMALDLTNQIATMAREPNTTSFDNPSNISASGTLAMYLEQLNAASLQRFGKSLRIALQPKQQLIGNEVFELAFLYDADGCLIELLHKQTELTQSIDSGWEPPLDLEFKGKT